MAVQLGWLPRNKFNAIYSLTMGKWHSLAVSEAYPLLSTCLPTGAVPCEHSQPANINLFAPVCFSLPAWLLKPIPAPKPNKYKHSSQSEQQQLELAQVGAELQPGWPLARELLQRALLPQPGRRREEEFPSCLPSFQSCASVLVFPAASGHSRASS